MRIKSDSCCESFLSFMICNKSKYESSELVGNNDEMAYMIDESTVAESHSDMGSPQLLNGSGSTDSLSEGDNYSHSFSMDAKCSITKSLERSEQAADDTVV
ncbi:unnamed protein product [Heligmosomoides polygyrus]|uniref:NR LBD domain-containing protein n=1 Tax=Heligmosomoides polygyrus TaxID=6339 RepID=A0A183G6U1_HELPZ|nr:unnamed protein product [Heligmosomoides polygyrus]